MKKKYILIIVLIIVLVGFATFFISDRRLDINSEEITKLYGYLGEVDLYHCGGLNAYSKDTITKDSLDAEDKLCMAYYELTEDKLTSQTLPVKGTNEYDTKYCELNEITFATADDSKVCSYEEFSVADLNNAYAQIYGEKPSENTNFYVASKTLCSKEGEKYYCGEATSYNVAITADADVYRLKSKAVEKFNGDIVIYDYFLKISENKCYLSSSSEEKSSKCTSKLSKIEDFNALDDTAKTDFVKKYGALYKHTYKKTKNGYYWEKSAKK